MAESWQYKVEHVMESRVVVALLALPWMALYTVLNWMCDAEFKDYEHTS